MAKLTKLSLSSVYEAIKELKDLILELNSAYKINFSNEFSWSFKRLNDSAKLYMLKNDVRFKILELKREAQIFYGTSLLAFVVFGSTANMESSKNSDIDYLVIIDKRNPDLDFLNYLTLENRRQFFERELPLIQKKVIHDREVQLNTLKKKIDKLLFDDQVLVYDKVNEFIKLKCRILLLKSNIIPKSNKELLSYMEEKYPKYYKAYKTLKRENAKELYIKLASGYYD